MGKDIQTFITRSEAETLALGQKIGQALEPGTAISLEGDLGTGKTALTKGIALSLGITEPITSPTFTLVNTYEGTMTLHHFDVYRVEDAEELYTIGWEEYFSEETITVVEWGNLFPELLPPETLHIKLSRQGNDSESRIITIERQVM